MPKFADEIKHAVEAWIEEVEKSGGTNVCTTLIEIFKS
jgi:hypothetical protein